MANDEELKNITADTVQEFMTKAYAAIGHGKDLGVTEASNPTWTLQFDTKGRVTEAPVIINVHTVRAFWTGGKPNDQNKKALEELNKIIEQHEAKHRKIATDAAARKANEARGKPQAQAEYVLKKILNEIRLASDDLDAHEGKIEVQQMSDGSFRITQGPAP